MTTTNTDTMDNTRTLSPAAQAVMTAATMGNFNVVNDPVYRQCIAAALRAAADQVVPHIEEPDWGACNYMKCDIELYTDHQRKRAQLLAIAAELKAQPEPVGPTDEQINQCYAALYGLNTDKLGPMPVRFGRELLARWGRSAIEPIPVSERLPTEADCDVLGRCWMCGKVEGDWRLISTINPGVPQLKYTFSHWLPHWALPIPRSEEI